LLFSWALFIPLDFGNALGLHSSSQPLSSEARWAAGDPPPWSGSHFDLNGQRAERLLSTSAPPSSLFSRELFREKDLPDLVNKLWSEKPIAVAISGDWGNLSFLLQPAKGISVDPDFLWSLFHVEELATHNTSFLDKKKDSTLHPIGEDESLSGIFRHPLTSKPHYPRYYFPLVALKQALSWEILILRFK
jgi:hypothetical protein